MLLALLGLAFVAAESAGWRWLRQPVAHALARSLGAPVSLDGDFRLQLAGAPRLSVGALRVAPSPGSDRPFTLDAQRVALQWRWADLWAWYRGAPMRLDRAEAEAAEAYAGRRGAAGDDAAERLVPALAGIRDLRLRHASVHVDDRPSRLVLELQLQMNEGTAFAGPPSDEAVPSARYAMLTVAAFDAPGFHLQADGRFRDRPVHAVLTTSSLLPLVARDEPMLPMMVSARGGIGDLRFRYEGAVVDLTGRGAAGDFALDGPSVARLAGPLRAVAHGASIHPLHGHLRRIDADWQVRLDPGSFPGGRANEAAAAGLGPIDPAALLRAVADGTPQRGAPVHPASNH